MTLLKDVKVYRMGRQLLINIPSEIAKHLSLKPSRMKILYSSKDILILTKGEGEVKVLDVGKGKLRLYIAEEDAPFSDGERVLITIKDGKLLIKRIDYYVVKPTIRPGQYRVNIPWELVEKTGLNNYEAVKVYGDGRKIVIEPLEGADE